MILVHKRRLQLIVGVSRNIFDALCSAVSEPELKPLFLKSEGVDLMILMLKCVLLV